MAGMLPGVECARRRRLHQSNSSDSFGLGCSTRRSSLCLYTSNHDNSSPRSTFSLQRSVSNEDEKIEEAARRAKERLDERLRLRTHRNSLSTSKTKRHSSSKGSSGDEEEEILQTGTSGSKKSIVSLAGLICLV